MKYIQGGIDYIAAHPEIRDVILSGGDPLMLTDFMLERIIAGLRAIPHVEIIRLGTKMPCVLPQRITPKLCKMLRKYHPIYINTHFNHPWECTPEAKRACEMLADAGIPVGNQAVLMKGVNDNPDVMLELMRKLLAMRVRPYYLYQADITKGANHFRTPVSVGLDIMDKLRGHTSGLAIPHFVIDAPGGGGKIPLLPQYVLGRNGNQIILRNYKYDIYTYPDVEENAEDPRRRWWRRSTRGRNPVRRRCTNPTGSRCNRIACSAHPLCEGALHAGPVPAEGRLCSLKREQCCVHLHPWTPRGSPSYPSALQVSTTPFIHRSSFPSPPDPPTSWLPLQRSLRTFWRMRIPDDKIEEVRSASDVVDVISSFVRLKKRGKSYIGLCPFHQEKTPSFTVSPKSRCTIASAAGWGGMSSPL